MLIDLAVGVAFLAASWWVFHALWADPAHRVLADNPTDQTLDEWFLALGPQAWRGHLSLVTHLLNAPDGVNLLANASLLGYGVLLAPVTVAFGVPVAFAVAATGNLAATGFAWYLMFFRGLHARRIAAVVGGTLCGFAPDMISQSNAHLHISGQWLVPAIVWCVIRLVRLGQPAGSGPAGDGAVAGAPATGDPATGDPATGDPATGDPTPARSHRLDPTAAWGGLLGLLIAVQYLLGEEILFLTAVTLVLFGLGWAARSPLAALRAFPPLATGLIFAAGVASLLLAYPLVVQFAGPQHVSNSPFNAAYFHVDALAFTAFSPLSLAGSPAAGKLASGPAEYNAFLGWPLPLAAGAFAVWRRRRPAVIPALFTALVMGAIAMGPVIVVNGRSTGLAGPYRLLAGLPVVNAALPPRFALPMVPLLALIIVLGLDAAMGAAGGTARPEGTATAAGRRRLGPFGATVATAATAALVLAPIAPRPLPVAARPALPAFITGGYWRTCVRPGGVLVPVPLPTPDNVATMGWAAAAADEFALPQGDFIGPYAGGGRASMGTYKQPTSALLDRVADTGEAPAISAADRTRAQADLRFWHASCVALVPGPHAGAVKTTVDALLGPGKLVAGTWIWPVG